MKIFDANEKSALKSAFLEYAKDLPSEEDLQNIMFSDGFEHRMTKAIRRQKTVVLRRVVAICACLALIVGVAGYFARVQDIPDVTPPQVDVDGLVDYIYPAMESIKYFGNEFFIAKVTTKPKKTMNFDNETIVSDDTPAQTVEFTSTICTAEVIRSITTETVTEGEKIKLFNYVFQSENSYAKKLEKGKTYLISARIEPHNQSAAVVCELAAELDGDTLLPTNSMTEIMFKDTDTLTQFLDNEHVKKMIDGDIKRYYNFHYEIIKTKDKIYTYKNDEDYFMEKIKDSIKPGAKKIFTSIVRSYDDFQSDIYVLDSVFTAKVIKREKEIKESGWTNHQILKGTPVLYHIEVEDNMWSFFEGSPTVKLVFYENEEQLEIGQTYLFSVYAQPLEDSAVLVERNTYIAKVNGKKLIPITEKSKINLKGLDTFKKLKNSNNYLALTLELFDENDYPNNAFEKYIARQGNTTLTMDESQSGVTEKEYNEYLDRLKRYLEMIAEAIKVGSDVTITKMEG